MEKSKKASFDKGDFSLKHTEIQAGIVGVATALIMGWVKLRKEFYSKLKKTGIYDEIIRDRDKAYKKLDRTTPNFFEELEKLDSAYRKEVHIIHEEKGLTGIRGVARKFNAISKSDKMEVAEKAGTLGAMAAAAVVGIGVVMKLSEKRDLEDRLDRQERARAEASRAN